MSQPSDIWYIQRVKEGDVDAFRYLVKAYQEMSYSIAISMVKNDFDAKEVVQSAFIKCYKGLNSFKGQSRFSSWLYKIVVNEALRFLRKKKSRSWTVRLEEEAHIFQNERNQGLKEIEQEEKKKEIKKVLQLMKPKEALMLKLFYLHELSILEIEEITGFSKSNVKVLLHRARLNFSKKFKHSEDD